MRRFRYMSHSYGILQGKAFKKLLRNVMQQANDGKKVIFENQRGLSTIWSYRIPANKSQFWWFLFVLIHNFKPLTNITIVVNKRKHGHLWKALAGKFTRPLALRARPSITTRITRTWRYPEKRLIYFLLLQKYPRTLRVFEDNREVIEKKGRFRIALLFSWQKILSTQQTEAWEIDWKWNSNLLL